MNTMFYLYEEDNCLNYFRYAEDFKSHYDNSITYCITKDCVIDDFHIFTDDLNYKVMLVTKNNMEVIELN
jgi:hypothetical protein